MRGLRDEDSAFPKALADYTPCNHGGSCAMAGQATRVIFSPVDSPSNIGDLRSAVKKGKIACEGDKRRGSV